MSCTSFLWASCVFLLQHGVPFFSTFAVPLFLLAPFLVSIIVEMSGDLVDEDIFFSLWDFCAVGGLSYRACAIMYAVAMGTSE